MKLTVYLILILTISFHSAVNAADTLKIRRTVKQLLNSSGQPYNYRTIKQQFYDPDGTIFREINYNDVDGELTSYLFYFYKDGKLFTEELHNSNDSLEYILVHSYDREGNEIITTRYLPSLNSKKAIADKQVRKFKNGNPVQLKNFTGKTLVTVTKYLYDDKARLIKEVISHKSKNEPVISETKEYFYTNDSLISKITVSVVDRSSNISTMSIVYEYNKDGRLSSINRLSQDGSSLGKEVYQYRKKGEISQYEQYDQEGKRTLMLQYEYLNNYMEKGIQKSHYENL